jgi:hypothetical protein
MLLGRVIAGFGVGFLSMIVPVSVSTPALLLFRDVKHSDHSQLTCLSTFRSSFHALSLISYQSEVSPAHNRGLLGCVEFTGNGQSSLSNHLHYSSQKLTPRFISRTYLLLPLLFPPLALPLRLPLLQSLDTLLLSGSTTSPPTSSPTSPGVSRSPFNASSASSSLREHSLSRNRLGFL